MMSLSALSPPGGPSLFFDCLSSPVSSSGPLFLSGSSFEGEIETGWAAPMLVPGAMAAILAESVMNTPADVAEAPLGET